MVKTDLDGMERAVDSFKIAMTYNNPWQRYALCSTIKKALAYVTYVINKLDS